MRIDPQRKREKAAELASRLPAFLRSRYSVALAFAALFVVAGISLQRYGFVDDSIRAARKLKDVPDLVQVMRVQPETIRIDIKHKHALALDFKRKEALDAGVLVSSTNDFVPATITHGETTIPVDLRIKGDLQEHWNTDKVSFRVVAKQNKTLFGMKQFSIQRPDARNFLHEWFYHRALAREGLVAIRYSFLNVVVNGEDRGIFALEEHFEKRLLENNRRREGPIIRFNEDVYWLEARDHGYLSGVPGPSTLSGEGSYLGSSIDGFQSSAWLENETERAKYIAAVHLLEAFRSGDLPPSQVFDVPKLAMFLALSDMLQAQHATRWRNIRFYYNPVSSRLEPIGFDGTQIWGRFRSITPMMNWHYKSGNFYDLDLYNEIFRDQVIYREYIRALDTVSAPGYLEDLIAELGPETKRFELIIRRDYPWFRFSEKQYLDARQYIRSMVSPNQALHAHFVSEGPDAIKLDVGNLHFLPMEIVGIAHGSTREMLSNPIALEGRLPDALVDHQRISLPVRPAAQAVALQTGAETLDTITEIRVLYRVLGTERLRESGVFPYPAKNAGLLKNLMHRPANVGDFEFIRIDQATRRAVILPGLWTISKDLIVPPGYRLVAGPGTQIELNNKATILSRSAVEFRGNSENPLIIRAGQTGGGGLIVMEADGNSVLENTIFDGLSAPVQPDLTLTGAVTFYRSPVSVRDSHFLNAAAEDALNIINTNFEIFGSTFLKTASDALDVDFGEGEIVNSRFEDTGNDAIDVSGSAVFVRNVIVRNAGDKAISAGESSRLSGSQINIDASIVGIASKDVSWVDVEEVTITNTSIGLAAYQKKPEFGPGTIEVDRLNMRDVTEPNWIEQDSVLAIDGNRSNGTRTNPREVFYPDEV